MDMKPFIAQDARKVARLWERNGEWFWQDVTTTRAGAIQGPYKERRFAVNDISAGGFSIEEK